MLVSDFYIDNQLNAIFDAQRIKIGNPLFSFFSFVYLFISSIVFLFLKESAGFQSRFVNFFQFLPKNG
jgi:hypothetical protein